MGTSTVRADEAVHQSLVGQAIVRREDPALVTGRARYTDDLTKPRMAHMAVLRSRYSHAIIRSIDTSGAESMDGVVAVLTGADLAADDDVTDTVPPGLTPPETDTMRVHEGPYVKDRPLLARDRVRYTGEAVAIVVAEGRYTAHDAVDAIEVDYERLDAAADAEAALADGAPQLHDDVEDNVAFVWSVGDEDAAEAALEAAATRVPVELTNQRIIPNAMEPRGALADFDPADGSLEVHLSTQGVHNHRTMYADVLGLAEHRVRVVGPAVGGGFGTKSKHYHGEPLAGWASMRLGRPVKWASTRTEAMRTDAHGRSHRSRAELALDEDGNVTGLYVDTTVDVGAYLSSYEGIIATSATARMLSGCYDIPALFGRITAVYTNATPVDAYRGAGRPEAAYLVERTMDAAAAEVGVDPAELRRRNFIPPEDFPKPVPTGVEYDSGEYERALDLALEHVGYDAFRDRQATARERGEYLGLGICSYVESCAPAGVFEGGLVRFHRTGTVTVQVGTFDHGQGHHTTYAQLVADRLGVDYDDVEIRQGDTAEGPEGNGTGGSRSAAVGGGAIAMACDKVVERARRIAAHQLEAAEPDLTFEDGEFRVVGAPDRAVHITEVAAASYDRGLPADVEPGLEATAFYSPENYTFPFGTHVVTVAVDVDTGEIDIEDYVAVDDCGPIINPKIVEGQVHGGVAQGLGQALLEGAAYDDNGTLVTGSFQDYAMPRAADMPEMVVEETVTPCPHNPLGVKGVGEAGAIAAPPAIVNAVLDALRPLGVGPDDLDMPLTPETVWQAIQDASEN